MSLISTYREIQASELYPDRITLHIQLTDVPSINFAHIQFIAGVLGLRRSSPTHFSGTLSGEYDQPDLPIRVTRPTRRAPLSVYADINPLKFIHDLRPSHAFDPERSLDGKANWLHPDDIRCDNRGVWSVADTLANHAVGRVRRLFAERLPELDVRTTIKSFTVGLAYLELAADFAERNRASAMERFRPAFEQVLKSTLLLKDGASAAGYEALEGSSRMISGFRVEKERYKAYAKTNHRFRIESSVSSSAIRSMGRRTRLSQNDSALSTLIGELANHQVVTFNKLLLVAAQRATPDCASPLQLIHGLSVIRDLSMLHEFLQDIVFNNRIQTNRYPRSLIKSLEGSGILTRGAHGTRVFTPRFYPAARALVDSERDFFIRGGGSGPKT